MGQCSMPGACQGCKMNGMMGCIRYEKHHSLRSKRFRRVWEQRNTEERGFRYFACEENGARAKKKNKER